MKFQTPIFEIWDQGTDLASIWSHVARCVRVCYQSESSKNPNESDEGFVKRVILRHDPPSSESNHTAMLEHGTIYLKHEVNGDFATYSDLEKYEHNKYSKYNCVIKYTPMRKCTYVTTNLRVIIENDWIEDLLYLCSPTCFHENRVTVSFITNIGVSREFNRHRVNSVAEESTRYCNYTKDKFDNCITFATPNWDISDEAYGVYKDALCKAEDSYNKLIALGWTPQQAREVLPLATKTQLVHTAFVSDWKHFFSLRAEGISGSVHPNAKFIAQPLMTEFIERGLLSE